MLYHFKSGITLSRAVIIMQQFPYRPGETNPFGAVFHSIIGLVQPI